MISSEQPAGGDRRPGLPTFLIIHGVLILAAVGALGFRARQLSAERVMPSLRPQPLVVPPLHDYEVVVTDEQLSRALSKLGLRFEGDRTVIGFTDHALRFWTPSARFTEAGLMSGEDMRRLLTDDRRFTEVYGEDRDSLLIDVARKCAVRAFEGNASSSHIDHTMACLAEVGTPLDFPIVTPDRQTTYRAMVAQSLNDFSLNQFEYEWSTLTYALFLPPTKSWVTSEGQRVSFDSLAQRLMREELPRGVCSANHRLHSLVMFLRVDDQMEAMGHERILAPEIRKDVIGYLQNVTATFVRHQHPQDGFWNGDWPESAPESREPTDQTGDRLRDRLIVTGHVMEWWALSPPEIHPPRPVLAAAGQWLVRTIDGLTPQETRDYSSFLSHAGRALALWRSRSPAEVIRESPVATAGEQQPSSASQEELQ